jgi:hypothetical protein
MLAVLSLVALPGLMHAQASELAGAGQSPAGQLPGGPMASAVPTQKADVTAPLMDSDPVATDQSVTSAADALPIIDQVPVPSPDEPAVPSPASATGLGPTLAAATAGVRVIVARDDRSTTAAAHKGGLSTDAILMIVGAAALLAGLLIGGGAGTAIAVAGAVVGLYGLYLYLQ